MASAKGDPKSKKEHGAKIPDAAADTTSALVAEVAAMGPENLGREMSVRTVLFHQAVAEHLGLNMTDHRCLDLAARAAARGPVTAGWLAEATGLTSGAITGVLDRLERAGFIRRDKDPKDRRQVIVGLVAERQVEIERLLEPAARAWQKLASRYDERQLGIIHDFIARAIVLQQEETTRLRRRAATQPGDGPAQEIVIPSLAVRRGRIETSRGLSSINLAAGDAEAFCRIGYQGPAPKVAHEVSGDQGKVRIDYGRLAHFDWRRQCIDVRLNPTVRWSLAVRGGLSKLDADLSALSLETLEISGGASDIHLRLPQPDRPIALRVQGGLTDLHLRRPVNAPLRVHVRGGASQVSLDTLQLGSVGGEVRWQSPDFAEGAPGYDLEVRGGASRIGVNVG